MNIDSQLYNGSLLIHDQLCTLDIETRYKRDSTSGRFQSKNMFVTDCLETFLVSFNAYIETQDEEVDCK